MECIGWFKQLIWRNWIKNASTGTSFKNDHEPRTLFLICHIFMLLVDNDFNFFKEKNIIY